MPCGYAPQRPGIELCPLARTRRHPRTAPGQPIKPAHKPVNTLANLQGLRTVLGTDLILKINPALTIFAPQAPLLQNGVKLGHQISGHQEQQSMHSHMQVKPPSI